MMTPIELLEKWHQRAGRIQTGHYEAACQLEHRHYWLGVPAITLSLLVSSSMFSALGQASDSWVKWFVATASVATAILAGMQTVLRYGERAASHKIAGVRYGSVKRELEKFMTFIPEDATATEAFVERVRVQWDELNEESPSIPQRVWNRVQRITMLCSKSGRPLKLSNARDAR